MKPNLTLLFLIATGLLVSPTTHSNTQSLEQEAKLKIKQFATELNTVLSGAIQQGGLQKGITVCHTKAPKIAEKMSNNGWEVSRISLKNRNPNNAPDESEKQTLIEFEQLLEKGESISNLVSVEHTESEFKLIKAIPAQPLCLSCHGKNIEPKLKESILSLYSNDMATGFDLGDIRGAFVVKKKI